MSGEADVGAEQRHHGPLQALTRYYERMEDAEALGWSREKFGWCVVIDADGEVVDVQDLHDVSGKKPVVKAHLVPASFARPGTTPRSFFLWDKTAFSLGVTKDMKGKGWQTSARQHEAFRQLHLGRLAEADDEGLVALRRFIERWTPDQFGASPFRPEMIDANIVFRLDGDRDYIHRRPAAQWLVETGVAEAAAATEEVVLCLASGDRGPIQRLHPSIKGVEGAQTAGASLVAFEQVCSRSYGKEQGANAPTSQGAAFRYGAALNRMLARDSRNRVSRPIGDATTVYWADASDAEAAAAADAWMGCAIETSDAEEAVKIADDLEKVAKGRPLAELRPAILPGTRFHVLGLAPNAARLSVRYWMADDLEVFARNLAAHREDLALDPKPHGWGVAPSVTWLLAQTTAFQRDSKNIPHQLAGEVMRAVLTGGRYPKSWLAAAVIRLRAGDDPSTGWHAAVIRAVLFRDQRKKRQDTAVPEKGEAPVSLDRDHPHIAYQLGRLFAIYEAAQEAALGYNVKATMRDKYYGAAAATPAGIMPLIISNGQNHLAKARKTRAGRAAFLEKELQEVMGRVEPKMPNSLPRSLRLEDQGEFAIGYYHQREAMRIDKGQKSSPANADATETDQNGSSEHE